MPRTAARARVGTLSVFFAGIKNGQPSADAPGGQPVFLCHAKGRIYWSNSEGRVWTRRLDSEDELREIPTNNAFVAGLTCDATSVYFGSRRRLVRQPMAGQVRTLSSTPEQPLKIVLHRGFAYFDMFRRSAIWRAPLSGGIVRRLVRTPRPGQVIFDSKHMYWTDYARGTINRARLDGRRKKVLARNQRRPIALVADKRYLYWGSEKGGMIRRMRKSGGTPRTLVRGQVNHDSLQLHNGYIYWGSWSGGKGNHVLARVPVGGGKVQVVVDSLWMPRGLTMVGDDLFFINKGEATILQLALR